MLRQIFLGESFRIKRASLGSLAVCPLIRMSKLSYAVSAGLEFRHPRFHPGPTNRYSAPPLDFYFWIPRVSERQGCCALLLSFCRNGSLPDCFSPDSPRSGAFPDPSHRLLDTLHGKSDCRELIGIPSLQPDPAARGNELRRDLAGFVDASAWPVYVLQCDLDVSQTPRKPLQACLKFSLDVGTDCVHQFSFADSYLYAYRSLAHSHGLFSHNNLLVAVRKVETSKYFRKRLIQANEARETQMNHSCS